MEKANNREFYKKFQGWLDRQNQQSRTLSIKELEAEIGCRLPEKCTWSNSKSDTISKKHLERNYLVTEENGNLTFEYNESTANAILKGKGLIVLNNMYTGRYISSWGNLGHEAINMMRADAVDGEAKGKFYIWLNSMGVCQEPIDEETGCTVLMVRSINSTLYKVIAKAEGCKLCPGVNIPRTQTEKGDDKDKSDKEIRYEKQKDLATYKGVKAVDIYAPEEDMFATFYADEVLEAKGDVYLTNKESQKDIEHLIYYADFKIGETMRAYIGANHSANANLKEFLNEDIWKEIDDSVTIEAPEFNFFKLVRKDKDELALSNALAYFIDKVSIKTFLEADFLNIDKSFSTDEYKMFREKNNIDISFFGEKNVVIIENKIDAGITAKASDKIQNQINDAVKLYHDKTKCSEDEYKKEITTVMKQICPEAFSDDANAAKKHASQLSKYYTYAVAYLLNKEGVKPEEIQDHIKCFILIPEYSKKNFKMNDYYLSGKYTPITYDDILGFFKKEDNTANIDAEGKQYFKDFMSVLEPLAKKFDNELEEEMKYRLSNKIEELKKNDLKEDKVINKIHPQSNKN